MYYFGTLCPILTKFGTLLLVDTLHMYTKFHNKRIQILLAISNACLNLIGC